MFALDNELLFLKMEDAADEIKALKFELRLCRNALIIVCDGRREAVNDAYADALDAKTKKRGWKYK